MYPKSIGMRRSRSLVLCSATIFACFEFESLDRIDLELLYKIDFELFVRMVDLESLDRI